MKQLMLLSLVSGFAFAAGDGAGRSHDRMLLLCKSASANDTTSIKAEVISDTELKSIVWTVEGDVVGTLEAAKAGVYNPRNPRYRNHNRFDVTSLGDPHDTLSMALLLPKDLEDQMGGSFNGFIQEVDEHAGLMPTQRLSCQLKWSFR